MEILRINKLSKSFGEKKLFGDLSLVITDKLKIGLVGKNGVGKSTLLKILANLESQDSGEIIKGKNIKIGYLEQQPNYSVETVDEVLGLAYKEITELSKRMHELEDKMARGESGIDKNVKLYGILQEKFEILGGYEIDHKVRTIKNGFNFDENFCERKFSSLSGGQKVNVLLAKLLIESPQILLLDEPTNYLDLSALKWLENYISSFNGAVIVVSHDRFFLDRAVGEIAELRHDGVDIYKGNYSYYVEEKERKFQEQQKDYLDQQKNIKRMNDQIKWMQSTGSNVLKSKAHQIEARLERMDIIKKPKVDNRKIRLSLLGNVNNRKRVLELVGLSKSYDNKLFENVNASIIGNDSVGIIGDNGIGKTTLLNIILGKETPDSGTAVIGEGLKVGFLDQESRFNDETMSVLDAYCYATGEDISKARTELAKLMFVQDDVFKKLSVLSGGEKKKLKLSILMHDNPNLLILDEPSNHLDLASREELESKLLDFDGALLFVSHDRYFLNKMANKIWQLKSDGLFKVDGNYDDYCLYIEMMLEEERENTTKR